MIARCSLFVSTCPGKMFSDTMERISVSNQSRRMSAWPPFHLVSQHFNMASISVKSVSFKHPLQRSSNDPSLQ